MLSFRIPIQGQVPDAERNSATDDQHQDVAVNITREDGHNIDGKIGEYWELIHTTPRLLMRGHDTVLELKPPYTAQQPNQEQEVWRCQGGRLRVTKSQSVHVTSRGY